MDFHDAELKYTELKKQLDTSQIAAADFTAHVHELRVLDHNGVWWQIREQDGGWLRWNGSLWEWGNPDISERPYSPVISDGPKQGIGGSMERFHALDADQKRKYLVLTILGIAALYAIFVFIQAGSGIGINPNPGGGFLSGFGGLPNIGAGFGGGPEQAVTDYFHALDNGDYSRAADLIVDSSQKPLSSTDKLLFTNYFSSGFGTRGERVEINDIKILNSQKISDSKYSIRVTKTITLLTGSPTPKVSIYTVVKVDGNWKIVADTNYSII
jgi:hypothetical protein